MDNHSKNNNLEKKIDAYLKGRLSEREAEELWVELMKKPEYISRLQTEIDLSRLHKSKTKAESDTNYYWRWIASAAAAVLLIITINVLTTGDLQPLRAWGVNNITLADNLSSAEVTRSAQVALEPSDSLLNAGFKAALSGQVDSAIAIYKRIINDYDSTSAISKAYLNLGILQYNSGNYKGSIDNFNRAIATAGHDSLLMEQSYWYLSNAYINTDQLNQARDAVQNAFSMGDMYKREAFKLLKRLDYELGNIDFDDFEQQIKESE